MTNIQPLPARQMLLWILFFLSIALLSLVVVVFHSGTLEYIRTLSKQASAAQAEETVEAPAYERNEIYPATGTETQCFINAKGVDLGENESVICDYFTKLYAGEESVNLSIEARQNNYYQGDDGRLPFVILVEDREVEVIAHQSDAITCEQVEGLGIALLVPECYDMEALRPTTN